MKSFRATPVFLLIALTTLLLPTLCLIVSALINGMGISGSFSALLEQFRSERLNLMGISLVGLFPVLLLGLILWFRKLATKSSKDLPQFAVAGAIPIWLLSLWANFSFWDGFFPERRFPGFPHGLEFVIVPGVFAPVAIIIAIILFWLFIRFSESEPE